MTDRDHVDEDGFMALVHDLPDATEYATALVMVRRDLARELLAAYRTEDGWRYRLDPDPTLIKELRAFGLATQPQGQCGYTDVSGWFVTLFALQVRNRMIDLLNSGELVEHDEAAE